MNAERKPIYDFRTDLEDTFLGFMLSMAVHWRMLEIVERGGITDEDIGRIQSYGEDLSGPGGTDLFFKSTKEGDTAKRFNQVADTLAVLAFLPGGIKSFGVHYDGEAMLAQRAQRKQLTDEAQRWARQVREDLEFGQMDEGGDGDVQR